MVTQSTGKARLRKYVTTEQETVTVLVRKEHAVLKTEPITDDNMPADADGLQTSEEEHEVVLHEEQVVVDTAATPVERVKFGTETTTEEQTVTATSARNTSNSTTTPNAERIDAQVDPIPEGDGSTHLATARSIRLLH